MSTTQAGIRSGRYPTLAELKQRTLHPVDAWWTVLVIDPLAIRLLWLLVRVWPGVTPNAVTLGSLVAGLGAGGAFLGGHLIWGALLYQLSFTLDCIDGKLARLKNVSSASGAFLDGLVNQLVYIACVVGLMLSPAADQPVLFSGLGLLMLRALHMYMNPFLPRPKVLTWSHFVAREGSWLDRHRLLPPGSFPDKHAVLFTLGPATGFTAAGMAINLVLEVMLLGAKLKKVLRQDGSGAPLVSGQDGN